MTVDARPVFCAEITHKGRSVARLEGRDRVQLIARAHCHAQTLNLHRAVVQIISGTNGNQTLNDEQEQAT